MKRNTHERQRAVAELAAQGKSAHQIAELLPITGIVNPRSGKAFNERTIKADMAITPAPVVEEMIGRAVYAAPFWGRHAYPVDSSRTDYVFWDSLRRGKAMGFELGGLFCQPIVQTLSAWTLGLLPTAALVDGGDPKAGLADERNYTDAALSRFLAHYHALLLRLEEDKCALGDQFVVVNADGTLSVPSPDTVTVDFAPNDYRTPVRYALKTAYRGALVVDEYMVGQRRVQMNLGGANETTYETLLGRLPVVHFANDRSANEQFGRPVYEGGYRMFSRYDDLLEKALDGAELTGNPLPVFEGLENVKETLALNSNPTNETYTDPTGATRQRAVIEFDRLTAVFVGKGGAFKFAAPTPGFTDDILAMLGTLDSLISRFSRIPGWLYGGAAPASKNDAESQLANYVQYITSRQVQLAGTPRDNDFGIRPSGGLYELIDLWLQTKALTDPRIVVEPVKLTWPDLTKADQQVALQKTIYARGAALLNKEDTLTQLHLVSDPKKAIKLAEEEGVQLQQQNANADNSASGNDFQQRMQYDAAHAATFGGAPAKVPAAENPAGGNPASDSLAQLGDVTIPLAENVK